MKDYYSILGVERTASADEIKRAYRKLASLHHPDKGGNKEQFQEIQQAYDVLGDANKRQQYDRPQNPFGFDPGNAHRAPGGAPFDFNNIFEMFGARFHDHRQPTTARLVLWITLEDVATGGDRVIAVGTHQGTSNAVINIPPGIDNDDTIRYSGIGPGGSDLVITFKIKPHPKWHRDGDTIITDVVCNVWQLMLGADLNIDTIQGESLSIVIPAMTQPGTVMRVRGRGLPKKNQPTQRHDMMVRVQARLPDVISPELLDKIRQEQGK